MGILDFIYLLFSSYFRDIAEVKFLVFGRLSFVFIPREYVFFIHLILDLNVTFRVYQIFTFGSVPLKTYLPDGDIDLTAFSTNQNLKDSWANLVRDMLEKEEKNENAEFHVKEVQYIQAEVCELESFFYLRF